MRERGLGIVVNNSGEAGGCQTSIVAETDGVVVRKSLGNGMYGGLHGGGPFGVGSRRDSQS